MYISSHLKLKSVQSSTNIKHHQTSIPAEDCSKLRLHLYEESLLSSNDPTDDSVNVNVAQRSTACEEAAPSKKRSKHEEEQGLATLPVARGGGRGLKARKTLENSIKWQRW